MSFNIKIKFSFILCNVVLCLLPPISLN